MVASRWLSVKVNMSLNGHKNDPGSRMHQKEAGCVEKGFQMPDSDVEMVHLVYSTDLHDIGQIIYTTTNSIPYGRRQHRHTDTQARQGQPLSDTRQGKLRAEPYQ